MKDDWLISLLSSRINENKLYYITNEEQYPHRLVDVWNVSKNNNSFTSFNLLSKIKEKYHSYIHTHTHIVSNVLHLLFKIKTKRKTNSNIRGPIN